jgi:N-acetylneuraminic acid mutarotase
MNSARLLNWSRLPDLPEALGLGGPFAGAAQGRLLVAGGTNFPDAPPWRGGRKSWTRAVYSLANPAGPWRRAGELPQPLAYGVSVSSSRGVVCVGGCSPHLHHAEVRLLEFKKGKLCIRELPSLPTSAAYGCGAMLNEVVYVAGGLEAPDSTRALCKFWAMDLSTPAPQWQELVPWPGPERMLAVAAVQNGFFYLVSGVSLSGSGSKIRRSYLRDAYRFSPAAGWTRIADVPKAVAAAPSPAAQFDRSRILVLGADDGSRAGFEPVEAHPGFSRDVFVYDTEADRWDQSNGAPVACAAVPMVSWDRRFVIPSGELRPGVRSPEVWSITLGSTADGEVPKDPSCLMSGI